jgi:hypothetical protein
MGPVCAETLEHKLAGRAAPPACTFTEENTLGLRTVPVNQCLDKKLLIFGYEIPEILVVFFLLSVLNFVFPHGLKLIFVWLPTVAIAVVLRIGKRGKPDNYLVHLVRHKLRPPLLSAFTDPTGFVPPPKLTKRGAS